MRIARPLCRIAAAVVAASMSVVVAPDLVAAGPWDGVQAWETASVIRIVDGDTMVVADEQTGLESRVRLIGVNAPEIQTRTKPGQCGWWQAKNALEAMAPKGTIVRLASADQRSIGLNGRPQRVALAYNESTGEYDLDLAWAIAEQGWALWFTQPVEAAMSRLYQAVVAGAQRRGVGLWNPQLCGSLESPEADLAIRIGRAPFRTGASGEWVSVRNVGDAPIDIGGWMLREGGLQGWYTFPPGSLLAPGDYRVVHTGVGSAGLPDGHDVYAMSVHRLYPEPGTGLDLLGNGAYLLDRAGNYRFWREYPCTDQCQSDPVTGAVVVDAVSIGTKKGQARTATQWIRLANNGDSEACLDGYRIDTGAAVYRIAPGTCIAAHGSWTLHAGVGRGNTVAAYWGRATPVLWESGTATLTSDREQVIATGTW